MAFKFIVFAAALAYANGGLLPAAAPAVAYSAAPAVSSVHYNSPLVSYGAPLATSYAAPLTAPAITSQQSNIIRSFGNLGQVSTYSKTIDTPFSSVTKADIRVSNPGLRIAAAPVAHTYAAPVAQIAHTYAAPVTQAYAAPVARAVAAPAAIGVAYSAAPAVSHVTYTGLGASYGW